MLTINKAASKAGYTAGEKINGLTLNIMDILTTRRNRCWRSRCSRWYRWSEKKRKKRKKEKSEKWRGGRYWQPAGETLPAVVVYWLMESCGTWYGKMEWREYVGRSSRKRFYWKAELDAAGFICAEENDKWTVYIIRINIFRKNCTFLIKFGILYMQYKIGSAASPPFVYLLHIQCKYRDKLHLLISRKA